ncbi:MAG: hypothetical protein JST89_02470 [Cyanobacteria bacterium SZAS-4]|nr:hypothetical protein [Cyanobacteria bacterium SZAS-4]
MKHLHRPSKTAVLFFATTILLCAYPAHSQSLSAQDKGALTKILKENETKPPSEAVLAQIQALIDKYPKDYYARLVMGNALDRVGMPMQAIEQYQLAVQNGPDSPQAVIELVKAQIGVGQKEAAMRLLTEASKRFPKDREIAFWMGNYYLTKGQIKMAEERFAEVARTGAPFFGMGTALAEIQLRQGRYGLAAAMVDNDLEKNPLYPLGNAIKGEALFAMRRLRQAEPFVKIAYAAFPFKQDYAKHMAEIYVAEGDYLNALEPTLVALANSSRSGEPDKTSEWLLSTVLSNAPRHFIKEQIPLLSDKIDKQFKSGSWHFAAAEILDYHGYHDVATTQYLRSFQLDPTQYLAAYRIANNLELYFQQYEGAIQYLSQAHALNPGSSEISDRLERLQSRLAGRKADLAWQLKDMLRKQPSPI